MTESKKVNPEDLARPDILSLQPYISKAFPGYAKMDANENPFPWPEGMKETLFNEELFLNRYPDSTVNDLREALVSYSGIEKDGILVGNGSDEIIQLILTTYGGSGRTVIVHPPTFGMYQVAAQVTGTKSLPISLKDGVNLDAEKILEASRSSEVSMIILCSPNNPTGTLFPKEELLKLVRETGKIIVMDEAYAEFSGQTLIGEIKNYPNLMIMRTFSKAFGLAGLRIGYLLGQPSAISLINKVRQPFNVNVFSQRAGVLALDYWEEYKKQIKVIRDETKKLYDALKSFASFKVFPTHSNFILFQTDEADFWAEELFKRGFMIRRMGELPVLGKCLRVSPGLPEENDGFIRALKDIAETT